MNAEPTELESPSAGTGIETPGQQCPPNEGSWEAERTNADGYLLVGMGSNQGEDTSPRTERVGTRAPTTTTTTSAASNIIFLQQDRKPRDKTPSENNKQSDRGGKGEKPSPWNGAKMISFYVFFPRGSFGSWEARCLCFVFFCLCVFSVCFVYCSTVSGDHFFSELKNIKGDAKKNNQEPGGQAPSCLSTP